MSTEKPVSGRDHQPQTRPEPQPTKRGEWSDLTEDQRALLAEYAREGIHLTPEMIQKVASGEIHYRPPSKSLDESIAAIHVELERQDGHKWTVVEGRRIEVGLAGKNKPNPDFVKLWKSGNMSLSFCIPKGYLSLGVHGGAHLIKVPLREHDVKGLLAALIAHEYRDRPEIPKEFKFSKSIRSRIRAAHSLRLAIANRNQVQTVRRRSAGREL